MKTHVVRKAIDLLGGTRVGRRLSCAHAHAHSLGDYVSRIMPGISVGITGSKTWNLLL